MKGNSLFGEVDDRRMEIERKMISLKVRYETLEKTHATTQHQLRKMKVHVHTYSTWSGIYLEGGDLNLGVSHPSLCVKD